MLGTSFCNCWLGPYQWIFFQDGLSQLIHLSKKDMKRGNSVNHPQLAPECPLLHPPGDPSCNTQLACTLHGSLTFTVRTCTCKQAQRGECGIIQQTNKGKLLSTPKVLHTHQFIFACLWNAFALLWSLWYSCSADQDVEGGKERFCNTCNFMLSLVHMPSCCDLSYSRLKLVEVHPFPQSSNLCKSWTLDWTVDWTQSDQDGADQNSSV